MKLNTNEASHVLRTALAGLMIYSGGCTAALWTPACQSQAVRPQISGILRNYPAAGEQSLVVSYQARGDGTDVDLVVPLHGNGEPAAPFAAGGPVSLMKYSDGPSSDSVAGQVPTSQLLALTARASSPAKDRPTIAALHESGAWSGARSHYEDRPLFAPDGPGTAWVLAYRFDSAGQVDALPVSSSVSSGQINLPEGAHLLIVPGSVNRPAGDRFRNQVIAATFTPVTVAGDTAAIGAGVGLVAAVVVVALPVVVVAAIVSPQSVHAEINTSATPATQPSPKSSQPVSIPIHLQDAAPINSVVMTDQPARSQHHFQK